MISEGSFVWAVSYISYSAQIRTAARNFRGGVNWTSMGFQPLDEMLTSNCGYINEDLNKRGFNVPLKLGSDVGLQYPANL
jgi:hypothetical protein